MRKVRQNPEPQLVKAISKEQFLMQGADQLPANCRHMKMTEKLSAARWAMMPAESLARQVIVYGAFQPFLKKKASAKKTLI